MTDAMGYLLYGQMILVVFGGLYGVATLFLSIQYHGHEKTHYMVLGFGLITTSMILAMF